MNNTVIKRKSFQLSPINIVTVTCSRDLQLQILQSHSIAQFATVPIIHHVYIEDSAIPLNEWDKKLSVHYRHRDRKLKIHYNTLPTSFLQNDGWARQQYLKLLAGTRLSGEYYIVLDSKNFFIKPTDFKFDIIEGSYLRQELDTIWYTLRPFVRYAADVLNKEIPPNVYVAITPFKILTKTIREMFKEHDIEGLFLSMGDKRPSEFTLYSLFADSRLLSIPEHEWTVHYGAPNVNYAVWWFPDDVNLSQLDYIYSKDYFAVHTRVWLAKTDNLNKFASWLVEKGLSNIYVDALLNLRLPTFEFADKVNLSHERT